MGERGLFWVLKAWRGLVLGLFGCARSCILREKILTSLPRVTLCGRGFELDAYRNAETS